MQKPLIVASMTLLAACTGCIQTVYKIDLKPEGNEITRTLSVKETSQNPSSQQQTQQTEELRRIATLYPEGRAEDREGLPTFVSRFAEQMPTDVGGAGGFTQFDSPLGSVSIYSERFRGNDDLAGSLAARQRAADDLIDLALGWIDFEFSAAQSDPVDDPIDIAPIKSLIDGELRQDFKNASLLLWMAGQRQSEPSNNSPFFRLAQYLAERNYFSLQQIPAIARLAQQQNPELFISFAHGLLAQKLTATSPDADTRCLDILKDRSRLEKSIRTYLKGTDEYKQLVAQQEQAAGAATPRHVDEAQVIGNKVMAALAPDLFSRHDHVEVTLHLPLPPESTNGTWDDDTKSVRWSQSIGDSSTPGFVFATWCVPDSEQQTTRFGSVIVRGGELSNYVIWYCGLTPAESKQWDTMLSTIGPDADAVATLQAFRFEGSPNQKLPIAATLARLIQNPSN
ncbi:hypothetical protein EC9_01370 [Rosistilla ulvae]|uniref:Uncharacterized protein n=1 Tax=Rosistilla ulvae TaxID=1930277 RepID=A0A517LTQ4_9BACT|nr:hypothetical protein [Rosistilla ulvae]QDS85979.1 hypothetical protein EC9_01370 [Rosistilla ulvae]